MAATPPGSEIEDVSSGLVVQRGLPPLGPWKRWIVVDREDQGRRLLLSMIQQSGDDADDQALDEAERRARKARSVIHPALTRVTDCGRIPGGAWVVEEIGEQEPICEPEAGEPPGEPELTGGLVRLIEALGYVHQQGLVHGRVGVTTVLSGGSGPRLCGLAAGGPEDRPPTPEDDVRDWAGLALEMLGPPDETGLRRDSLRNLLKRVALGSDWAPGDGRRMSEQVHAAVAADGGLPAAPQKPRRPVAETREPDVKRPSMLKRLLTGIGAMVLGALTTVITVAVLAGAAAAGLLYALEGGPPEAVVPNLLGMPYEEAAEELAQEGLKVGTLRRVYRNDVGLNQVAAMSPPPGMRVREGREVAVVVSRGSAEVKVPRVVGLQVSEAEKVLDKKGLTLEKKGQRRSNAPAGEVVSQAPAAGRMTGRGASVSVILSGGDEYGLVRVKDDDGETQTMVFRELEIVIPEGERIQRVTVMEGPEDAVEAVYDRPHRPGDRVKVQVQGEKGKRIEVQIEGETVYRTQL